MMMMMAKDTRGGVSGKRVESVVKEIRRIERMEPRWRVDELIEAELIGLIGRRGGSGV